MTSARYNLKNCQHKKNYNILFHRNQHHFYNESIVDSFFNSVKGLFTPAAKGKEYKIQAYFELKNYQRAELSTLKILGFG